MYYEDYRPVSDALILDYLAFSKPSTIEQISNTLHSFFTRLQSQSIALRAPHQITYIPTMAFWFFQILHSCFPRHHLILADFSHLPSQSEGEHAPVVQQKIGGVFLPPTLHLSIPSFSFSSFPYIYLISTIYFYFFFINLSIFSCNQRVFPLPHAQEGNL